MIKNRNKICKPRFMNENYIFDNTVVKILASKSPVVTEIGKNTGGIKFGETL